MNEELGGNDRRAVNQFPPTPAEQSLLQDVHIHAVLAWRSDSIMLARCRLIFMDLIADALSTECGVDRGEPCTESGDPRSTWCDACRLHNLADRVQRVTRD